MEKETQAYYQKDIQEVVTEVESDIDQGLTSEDAKKRLEEYGENRLESGEKVSAIKILLHKLNNIIVYLLLAAAIVSFITDETIEGFAILAAVFIAVAFGFITEYNAQKSIESLQNMIEDTTKVLREGSLTEINSEELVPGDLMFLEEGDSISADGRLVRSSNFAAIESALTGESEAVEKNAEEDLNEEVPLGDRLNMVFMGTAVTRGNAYALVTATGMDTEMGRISDLLKERKKGSSPLSKELDRLGKLLIVFAGISAAIVIVLGLFQGMDLPFIIQIALILAIAAIPEAMPAVSTITMARSMRIMAEHKALVKTMPAVETLGSTGVICTDKTGTLTENQMTVEQIYLADGSRYEVSGGGYRPEGELSKDDNTVTPEDDDALNAFIIASVLSSNATLQEDEGEFSIIGDPTEGALVVLGEKTAIRKADLESDSWEKIDEVPFESDKKYMMVAYRHEEDTKVFIKGAPDVLLDLSQDDDDTKTSLKEANEQLAGEGMRVLAVGHIPEYSADPSEDNLDDAAKTIKLLGLVGIIDPPREDVSESIDICQKAGILVKMITGDHPKTAAIIAQDIGINDHEEVLTGQELDDLSEGEDADKRIYETAVFARVSPENKLQIVDALRRKDLTVAMTGDGVNDAPALNGSDIGVAMGIRGTEVAKEASDMILTDDRFSTIVDAVREGRIIYANIKKYVYFLFSCNMVEILTVLLAILFFTPIPILPLHILWLNLVVDIFPAMALGFETAEDDIMEEPPRGKNEGLVNRTFLLKTVLSGLVLGLASFLVYYYNLWIDNELDIARTATFTTMGVAQLLHIFNVRRMKTFGMDATFLKNKFLMGGMVLSLGAMLLAIYAPFMNRIMDTTPLAANQWLVIVGAAGLATLLVHLLKKLLNLKG